MTLGDALRGPQPPRVCACGCRGTIAERLWATGSGWICDDCIIVALRVADRAHDCPHGRRGWCSACGGLV